MSKISFEINGKEEHLYFGMDAYEIVQTKSVQATIDNNVSNFKMCSYIIFGGMVNYAVLKEINKPTYEDAYLLTEQIFLKETDFQDKIFKAWNESLANETLQKVLNGVKKKAEESKKQTGTKSNRTPSVS